MSETPIWDELAVRWKQIVESTSATVDCRESLEDERLANGRTPTDR